MTQPRWRLACALWVLVILWATTIYSNVFVGHSHWNLVQWVPSPGTGTWLEFATDVLANIGLFAPLGFTLGPAGLFPTRRRLVLATAVSLALSMSVELVQVYSHNRLGATSDLMANTLGGLVGAYLQMKRRWG